MPLLIGRCLTRSSTPRRRILDFDSQWRRRRHRYSQHAGMVVVADGTDNSKRRLERVLTSDPGMGVLRHADAGYSRAIDFAGETED